MVILCFTHLFAVNTYSEHMADAGDTPVLSSRQKQFTVRAAKKKPMKAALCSPYSVFW